MESKITILGLIGFSMTVLAAASFIIPMIFIQDNPLIMLAWILVPIFIYLSFKFLSKIDKILYSIKEKQKKEKMPWKIR